MREGWVRSTLGDIAQVVGGGTPSTKVPEYWGGDIPWITPTEVVAAEGERIFDTERMITHEGLARSGANLLPEATVLLTSRATIGAVALSGRPMATNQGFAALIAGSRIVPQYLMRWCQAHKADFAARAGGNVFPEISRKNVSGVPIDVPPLHAQRRIVDLIDAVNHCQTISGVVASTASAAQSGLMTRMSESAVDLIELGDLVRLRYGKALKQAQRRPGPVPVLGSAGEVGRHNEPCSADGPVLVVGRKGAHALSSLEVPIRDDRPIAALAGYRGVGGAGSIRWSESECWVIDTAYWVAPLTEISPIALYWLLVLADLPSVTTKTTLPGLNRDAAYSVRVPAPNDAVLELVTTIEALQEVARAALLAVSALTRLRSLLLSDLLSGDHEISVSYDALLDST